MKILKLSYDVENYEGFEVANGDWSIVDKIDGKPLIQEWSPIELKLFDEPQKLRSDIPYFVGAPVFSKKAVELLGSLINNSVEILPIKFDREEYYIINVVNLLNCIDFEKSEVVKFRSGRIMKFKKYEFIADVVSNEHIFKIAEMPQHSVFVSEEFRNVVLASNLSGILFEEVWSNN
ncbi:hypothetical protein BC351_18410 [Paenibacillus ferrarius]|uniref:Immunity MXAN-0049 protein domain-containing protein n=1 Tax=Paenibacillus ferrarius TaxID=1469647 RepID=A0A1V4HQE3_9BACL|nr:DUF1629 domain-containing protein [Paenibacillus ferrarius]OPH60462.1 hypothetical protein BC351_18410 [Paenibacillus ferrarius]